VQPVPVDFLVLESLQHLRSLSEQRLNVQLIGAA
jgi:hypothetical protein